LAFSWTDKPCFLTEGKLAAVLIKPSSWGSQLDGDLHHQHRHSKKNSGAVAGERRRRISDVNYAPAKCQASFLAPLPGKKKTSARGVSHAHPLLCFKFCFTLILLASFYQKYKKIVSFIVIISLLLVHYVVS
jgi:hypothetical protein